MDSLSSTKKCWHVCADPRAVVFYSGGSKQSTSVCFRGIIFPIVLSNPVSVVVVCDLFVQQSDVNATGM